MASTIRGRFFQTIKECGGIRGSFWKLLRGEDLKVGALVGEDKYGNKYYENDRFFLARNRWVQYRDDRYWNYDASLVPPEWHRWLHNITDDPPTKVPPVPQKFIWKEHKENFSGTNKEYVPYSTTPKKIHEWVPPRS
ncbi:NADH dehydrogenase [ubiquinone] 1 alpha subcomplex subunit 12-like [Lytechinus variegatus]|uniref:NADH dehydrogenase [ubiquinone] 1 alpha subcomplex subunit 12-like n=1 Tax=Lytechinus variegatus TaxID=7654 RepID=UPI001BB15ADA|nr:NADH dehydrogenase [ubiquinone] 1 alpha subcomplex subunit 12-like [Lytechinus variegatus]